MVLIIVRDSDRLGQDDAIPAFRLTSEKTVSESSGCCGAMQIQPREVETRPHVRNGFFGRSFAIVPAPPPWVKPQRPSMTAVANDSTRKVSLPTAPSVAHTAAAAAAVNLSFTEAFGAFGLPMLFILVVCISWTCWLVFLTFSPNWTANHLMNTGDYDEGNFWLIVEPEPWMKVLSVSGFVLVALCYLYVLLKMLFWRNQVPNATESVGTRIDRWSCIAKERWSVCIPPSWRCRRRILALWYDLTGFTGTKRKFWVRRAAHLLTHRLRTNRSSCCLVV